MYPLASPTAPIRLCGYQRIWATLSGVPANTPLEPASAWLEFRFQITPNPNGENPPLGAGLAVGLGTTPDTLGPVAADIGSYRVRPSASVRFVLDPLPDGVQPWLASLYMARDPSVLEDIFWWTRTLEIGPVVPPPFYGWFKVMGGAITRDGVPVIAGHPYTIPGGRLTATAKSLIQWGFQI